MTYKTIVITGASDGIGAAAARQLCKQGHRVIAVGRSREKTERIAAELRIPFHVADYARLADVSRLAGELRQYGRIDVLANNAGGAQQTERTLTEDGNERTFQINLLGEFLLTVLLMDRLCESKATVIQTTSIAANLFGSDFDVTDLQNQKHYTPLKAYGYAKLGNILFTRELHRRFGSQGIRAVAFEPGIVRSNFGAGSLSVIRICYHSPLKYLFTISPARSAQRLTALANGIPMRDFICGEVYGRKKPMKVKFSDPDGAAAAQMWEACERLTERFRHPASGT